MKKLKLQIGNIETLVSVVVSSEKNNFLTSSEIEMDMRAEQAVKGALEKAKICKKPIAVYNPNTKITTLKKQK